MARIRCAAPLALAIALAGCSATTLDLPYYLQTARGHFAVLREARPIGELLAGGAVDPRLAPRLRQVVEIREFATRELALPANGSYRSYADIGRPFVVWNVFAAPELSLRLKRWCFPVAGCVTYRGYFERADAERLAQSLREQGWEVQVAGVPAYSTLGWFDDPVLSTFIHYPEGELARLIFHELAHQVVYVKDDTSFNESFAVAVEEEGIRRWLAAQQGRPDAASLAAEAARGMRLRSQFRVLVRTTRDRLAALYASGAPVDEQRAGKAAAFAAMRAEYERMKAGWDGVPAFDRWFAAGANNAGIAAAGLYADRVAAFAALLAAEGGDLPRFYERVRALAALPGPERGLALADPTAAARAAESHAPRAAH